MMRNLAIGAALALAMSASRTARGDVDASPYAGVSVEQLYDSNVENSHGADAVTRVTPRVGFLVEGPLLKLDADYAIGFHEYDQGSADNSINHRAAIVGTAAVTPRLNIDTRLVFLAGSDPILLDRPGIAIPEGGFVDFSGHLGTAYRATRRLTLEAAYQYRLSRFDASDQANPLAFDGDEHRLDLVAGYRLTRRWTLRAVARGQHFVSYGPTDALGDAIGGGGGFDYFFTPLTIARVEGGPLYFADAGATWFGLAELVHRGERYRWTLAALRDLYGGTSAAQAVWAESVQAVGTFRLTRRLDLRLRGAAYRNGIAPSGDEQVTGLVGRADIGWSIFGDNARIELYTEHRAQSAAGGFAFGDIQRTLVGVRLVAFAGADLLSLGDFQ